MARGTAALAAGALIWSVATPTASADQIRDKQWALKAFEAETKVWTVNQGEGVIVGVVDSGVNPDHQDLTGQVLAGVTSPVLTRTVVPTATAMAPGWRA